MSKRVIVLGAGYGGIEAALTLQKKKKRKDDLEITVIDKNSYHTLLTELHEVAGNRIDEDGVIIPLRDIFKYTDIKLVRDEIKKIDYQNNQLISDSGEYKYDYLIVAAGSEPNFYGIPGMQEYSYSLWSFEDALKVREHIKESFHLASQTADKKAREALLTFVVGGGGFTGVELIGEIAQWVKLLCEENDIPRNEVRLVLVEALPKILTNLKQSNIDKVMNYLVNKLKVEVLTNSALTKVTPDTVELKDGKIINSRNLIWTAGIKANKLAEKESIEVAKASRIIVDEFTRTQFKNVYAIGDIAAFNTGEYTLPALVEAAVQTGKAAAINILADINGKEKVKLKPELHGVMVSVGSHFAVSEIMGRQFTRLISILLKYMVNVHYLFGIGGFEQVLKYLKHEFFFKRHKKFLVEKHYSVMKPAFWLVPLRLYLGYSWFMEGYNKIMENWLTKPMLAGLPADTGSGASITETGEKVFRIIADHTPSWYAWIANHFIIPNALFFQILIVITEIGLGLAFITGSFTFIAGLVALALNINFILSTGLSESTWWFIPAEIAMLAGAGSAFGVDFYLWPYLMRQWRYFVRNRKIKLLLFK